MPSASRRPQKPRSRAPKPGSAPTRIVPSDDDVRTLAYQLFQARGGEPGHELEDWLQAERELRGNAK